MTGPTVYVPSGPPEASGFWAFEDQTERLVFVDAHAGSTVHTRWPVLDRWERGLVERGVDWLLNAAGAGRERLDAALRVTHPGSRLDRLPPIQSAYWHRLRRGVSGGATAQLFLGDGVSNSHSGLVVDDGTPDLSVSGFAGGAGGVSRRRGEGPGGGPRGASGQGYPGSYSTRGEAPDNNENAGPLVAPEASFAALLSNTYTAASLAMGGGGGGGTQVGGPGVAAGAGVVRRSIGDLTESTSRTLSGAPKPAGTSKQLAFGSGGGYYAIVARSYTLGAGVTITCTGGVGVTGDRPGGHGRVIIWYGDSASTSDGTLTDAELTTYQLLPFRPRGGARYI